MKTFKPYLALSKTIDNYVLSVVLSVPKEFSIEKIEQQEIDIDGNKYWGVIITVSDLTQVMNGPDLPILSTSANIDLDKAETYQTIKCVVQPRNVDGYGPAQDENGDIDFEDGN
jgi:hypothetical protein